LLTFARYATEIDVHFVRKSVRAIGKLAIKIESSAEECISCLLELVATKVSYIVQEATVVIRNIFRKYPNKYESIISTLCENLDSLDEPEAKAAMIWVIGQYADRIDNSDQLLDDFLYSFADEPVEVQLALLTATVKLFIQRPTKGQDLVPKVLKWATEETDNPDLRDRGYMYWRLLSSDPATAKKVVMGEKPAITAESEKLDPITLEEMCLNIGTLATVYLKPVQQVFRSARPKRLVDSPALQKQKLPSMTGKPLPEMNGAAAAANGNGSFSVPNGGLSASAAQAAEMYFASVGSGMGQMSLGDDDYGGGQRGGHGGETRYVVSQSNPQQVYQPEVGSGDLLA
jgi:AP-2 complex subunit beta-1